MSDLFPKQGSRRLDSVRPKPVAVVAVAGFVCSLLFVPVSPRAWHIGLGYALHMALSSLLGMVCMYGFWKMWRWSVYIYATLAMLDVLPYGQIGRTSPSASACEGSEKLPVGVRWFNLSR